MPHATRFSSISTRPKHEVNVKGSKNLCRIKRNNNMYHRLLKTRQTLKRGESVTITTCGVGQGGGGKSTSSRALVLPPGADRPTRLRDVRVRPPGHGSSRRGRRPARRGRRPAHRGVVRIGPSTRHRATRVRHRHRKRVAAQDRLTASERHARTTL